MAISEQDIEKVTKHLGSVYWRLNHLYFIKDKNGKKVMFKFNQAQEKFWNEKHNKNLILKVRQRGFTTLECIYKLDKALFNSYVDCGIIAHTVDDAEKIFSNKVKFAYENLPDWLKKLRKPNTDKAGEYRFPNNSSISVAAGFRGGTLSGGLHVSEYAKICKKYPEKAREIKSGAFNAVPRDGEIDIESTAEGMTGDFFEMCDKAMANVGNKLTEMDFKFHFFPWWDADDYRIDPEGIEITDELKKYFDYLKDDHEIILDAHQRAWYAKKSEEQDDDMKQEYPSYPTEAFMASGRPVFNQQKISRDIKRAKAREFVLKSFEVRGKLFTVKIHHPPIKDRAYAIGGDVAEGLEGGDGSTLSVIDRELRQCASFYGSLEPADHGRLMVAVARYYNNALVAPEQNNHGHATLAAIKDEKYYNVFRREVTEELGKDIQEKVGWLTTMKSKMKMIDDLKEAFRDDSVQINDEATLREMMTIIVEENGDIVMNSKDRTVALAIAIQAIKQATIEKSSKAFIPGSKPTKDVTMMSITEKMAYYKRTEK